MTLHLNFLMYMRKFYFLFYQCRLERVNCVELGVYRVFMTVDVYLCVGGAECKLVEGVLLQCIVLHMLQ
jgi:hypothetical protein